MADQNQSPWGRGARGRGARGRGARGAGRGGASRAVGPAIEDHSVGTERAGAHHSRPRFHIRQGSSKVKIASQRQNRRAGHDTPKSIPPVTWVSRPSQLLTFVWVPHGQKPQIRTPTRQYPYKGGGRGKCAASTGADMSSAGTPCAPCVPSTPHPLHSPPPPLLPTPSTPHLLGHMRWGWATGKSVAAAVIGNCRACGLQPGELGDAPALGLGPLSVRPVGRL